MDEPVRISVELLTSPGSTPAATDAEQVVIVDPLGGGAAALDALEDGAEEVSLAGSTLARVVGHLIPRGPHIAKAPDLTDAGAISIGDLLNCRPCAAALARTVSAGERVHIVAVAADGVYAAGLLVRTLLDELDHDATLDDGAGIAIVVASSVEDPRAGLLLSARGRDFEGQAPDGLTAVAQLDSVGVVGLVEERDGSLVAVAKLPTPGSAASG